MIDKFLSKLYERIGLESLTAEEIRYLLEEDEVSKNFKYVPFGVVIDTIRIIQEDMKREQFAKEEKERWHKPYKKFLIIEDGSVDLDNLEEDFEAKHPEIKIIVYRQGANKPEFLDLGE